MTNRLICSTVFRSNDVTHIKHVLSPLPHLFLPPTRFSSICICSDCPPPPHRPPPTSTHTLTHLPPVSLSLPTLAVSFYTGISGNILLNRPCWSFVYSIPQPHTPAPSPLSHTDLPCVSMSGFLFQVSTAFSWSSDEFSRTHNQRLKKRHFVKHVRFY